MSPKRHIADSSSTIADPSRIVESSAAAIGFDVVLNQGRDERLFKVMRCPTITCSSDDSMGIVCHCDSKHLADPSPFFSLHRSRPDLTHESHLVRTRVFIGASIATAGWPR